MVLVNYKKKEICHLISRMILVEHMVGLKPDVKKNNFEKNFTTILFDVENHAEISRRRYKL